jgi:hypothetical protein
MKKFTARHRFNSEKTFVLYGDYVTHDICDTFVWKKSGHWWKPDHRIGVLNGDWDIVCTADEETAQDFAKKLGVSI